MKQKNKRNVNLILVLSLILDAQFAIPINKELTSNNHQPCNRLPTGKRKEERKKKGSSLESNKDHDTRIVYSECSFKSPCSSRFPASQMLY
jgi:hypothetical protein